MKSQSSGHNILKLYLTGLGLNLLLAGCAAKSYEPTPSPKATSKKTSAGSSDGIEYDNSNSTVSIDPGKSSSSSSSSSSSTPNGSGTASSNQDPSSNASLPPGNQAVVNYANSNMGKQVGNGLCQALQDGALQFTSTSLPGASFDSTDGSLQLAESQPKLPGDIMHWAGGTNHNNYPAKAGDPIAPKINGYMMFKAVAEGHVSIIKEVISPVEIVILHQNVNNQKLVQAHTIRLDAITYGKISFFRPQPK